MRLSTKGLVLSKLKLFIFFAFLLRIFLSFWGTYEPDFYTFIAWSFRLTSSSLSDFYKEWCDYLPGYLYVLYFLASLKRFFGFLPDEIVYKFPAIVSDLLVGFLIYKIVWRFKRNERLALLSLVAYLFNPAVFANSALWGQIDSLTILFPLLSLFTFEISLPLSSVFLSIGALVKPQAAISLVPLLFLFWKKRVPIKKFFSYGFISFFTIVLLFFPFLPSDRFITELPVFVIERIFSTLGQYPYLSVNAFNFWGLSGFWRPDVGYLSFFVSLGVLLAVSFFSFLKLKKKSFGPYVLLGIVFAVSFLFFPRMHERHMLPVLAPLLISSVFYPILSFVYVIYSFVYVLNLHYAFVWLTRDGVSVFSDITIELLIILLLFSFAFWLYVIWYDKKNNPFKHTFKLFNLISKKESDNYRFPRFLVNSRILNFSLIFILFFSFVSRVYRLGVPVNEYFDEVYHAFTARLMLKGDPKAWEWWNPHPEGFAYEWSHPPMAKLGMQLGMFIFGENAFGWRFPAAFLGTLSVLLVYLISNEIFKDKPLSLFAAFIFSLDGLFLVASRIGMNDVYLLFFSLLSVYLFIKEKYLFSALALGFAFASKWSALWVLPILFSSFFVFKKKLSFSYVWFFVLPPLVYVASYTQMFLTGHSFDIFWGVQKQMWWYHTGLEAEHPYTSPWWSWPLLLRPVWLYTDKLPDGKVTNIYFFGNPALFWFGFLAIFYSIYLSWRNGFKKLAWIVFSYFVFFVPWAASPRIMFLYHYLPSIPFMSIACAFVLRRKISLVLPIFAIFIFLFFYFYPHLIGIPVSESFDKSYYWFSSWR